MSERLKKAEDLFCVGMEGFLFVMLAFVFLIVLPFAIVFWPIGWLARKLNWKI